jgi:hypothetical protein
MAALAGKGGKVMSGSDTLAFVESYDLTVDDEALETTGLGATYKSYIGRSMYGASFNINWRAWDAGDAGSLAFQTQILANAGTGITLKLYTDGTHYYSGTGIVTSLGVSTTVDGLVTGTASGVISGALAYN